MENGYRPEIQRAVGQRRTPDSLTWLSGCEQSMRSGEALDPVGGFCVRMVLPRATNTHLNVLHLSSHCSSVEPLLALPT